ncbi:MAG: gamma-glutamylcyclotransferase family protein [Burkholderiaceae bacterium]
MNAPLTLYYFAYGSNMLLRRMRERTPSARVVATGRVDRHELRWHKLGLDGSGKCDMIQVDHAGACVHGVVYEICTSEKPLLDAAESLGVGYAQKQVVVKTGATTLRAWLYHALSIDPGAVPYAWYKSLVVGGAKEHALDAAYLRILDAVVAKPDPDTGRARLHEALIGPG